MRRYEIILTVGGTFRAYADAESKEEAVDAARKEFNRLLPEMYDQYDLDLNLTGNEPEVTETADD